MILLCGHFDFDCVFVNVKCIFTQNFAIPAATQDQLSWWSETEILASVFFSENMVQSLLNDLKKFNFTVFVIVFLDLYI